MHSDKYKEIVREVLSEVGDKEWANIKVRAEATDLMISVKSVFYDKDTKRHVIFPPWGVNDIFQSLREEMTESKGESWNACIIEIKPNGEFSVDFDYETLPEWETGESRILE